MSIGSGAIGAGIDHDEEEASVCPVACALDLIGDKWTLLVVRDLACGKRFFNDLSRSSERIATNILADRLERLVAHGLVERYRPSIRRAAKPIG